MASLTLVKLLQFLLQELHKPAAPSQSTAKWSSNTSYFTLSILWAFIDLLNVVMNTSVSSDKVSLVNLSESTPNSVLGPRGSHSAKEAANFLIISSDLQALSFSIRLHSSSFPCHCFLYSSFCHSSSCLWDSSSQSSMNLLSSDCGIPVSPLVFPNVTAYRNQVAPGPLTNSQWSDPTPVTKYCSGQAEKRAQVHIHCYWIVLLWAQNVPCSIYFYNTALTFLECSCTSKQTNLLWVVKFYSDRVNSWIVIQNCSDLCRN